MALVISAFEDFSPLGNGVILRMIFLRYLAKLFVLVHFHESMLYYAKPSLSKRWCHSMIIDVMKSRNTLFAVSVQKLGSLELRDMRGTFSIDTDCNINQNKLELIIIIYMI